MIQERGVITQVQEGAIQVSTKVANTCGSCQQNQHCGTGLLAKWLAPKPEDLRLECQESVAVGQEVVLGVEEGILLKAAALIYMVPLLVLVIAAALMSYVSGYLNLQSEWLVIAVSFAAMASTFASIRWFLHRHAGRHFQPRLLQVLPDYRAHSIAVTQVV